MFGPPDVDDLNYNLREFEPLWDCIEDVDLPITFHVSTGRDPRTSRSNGGAIINYAVHSLAPTMEPIVNICASGVAERHPKLRFGAIEAGIGWVAWMLEAMDEAYRKHHMWVRPKLEGLPSEYFRRQGFATLPGGQGRPRPRPRARPRRQLPVGERLPPPRGLVAVFGPGDRAHDGRPRRRRAGQDPRPELGPDLFGFPIPERYLGHADAGGGGPVGKELTTPARLREQGEGRVATYEVNERAAARARELIDGRQYVLDSDWGEGQPEPRPRTPTSRGTPGRSTPPGTSGSPWAPNDETKARYAFVYGDFRRVHRTGLIACVYRASEWRHKAVELAAHDLLQQLDDRRR